MVTFAPNLIFSVKNLSSPSRVVGQQNELNINLILNRKYTFKGSRGADTRGGVAVRIPPPLRAGLMGRVTTNRFL